MGFRTGRGAVVNNAVAKGQKKGKVSPDENSAEALLQMELRENEYDVSDFYWKTGWAQYIATHNIFTYVTLFVISFNAVWMGIDADHNSDPANPHIMFQIGEQFFCVFFSIEWLIRFLAFERKCNCFRDGWFCFDSCLVLLMVAETWVMPVVFGDSDNMGNVSALRLLRLLRLSRMVRLMRSIPELVTLIKGLVTSARSVLCSIIILFMFTYVAAIVFKQQSDNNQALQEYFGDVPSAMFSLFCTSTLQDDITDIANTLKPESPALLCAFFLFMLLSSFTVLNMLIGVICQVVGDVALKEKEAARVASMREQLLKIMIEIDTNRNQTISKSEFELLVSHPAAKDVLSVLQINPNYLNSLSDVIFQEQYPSIPMEMAEMMEVKKVDRQVELPYKELLDLILKLRPHLPLTVKDVVDLRKFTRIYLQGVCQSQEALYKKVDELQSIQKKLAEDVQSLIENGCSPNWGVEPSFESMTSSIPKESHQAKTPAVSRKAVEVLDGHGVTGCWGTHENWGYSSQDESKSNSKKKEQPLERKKAYDVQDFYWEKGFWQKIARSDIFSYVTLGVISVNAIWMGIDTDHNPADTITQAPLVFQIGEHIFCGFFSFEWLVRFMSFKVKCNCLRDGWFKFDSFLVILMVVETWVLPFAIGGGASLGDISTLRLLRLLRLSRLVRLMRSFPELLTLVKGMAAATRSVGCSLVLLVIFTYSFAIVFKQQADGIEALEPIFSSVPEAMWTLFLAGTLLDEMLSVVNPLRESSQFLTFLFLIFVMIASFTLLNMLIGVLCEVIFAVSADEKEATAKEDVERSLLETLQEMDTDKNNTIERHELQNFVLNPRAIELFEYLGIDLFHLMSLSDIIFGVEKKGVQEKSVSLEEMMELILHLRQNKKSTVRDVVEMQSFLHNNLNSVSDTHIDISNMVLNMTKSSENLRNTVAQLRKGPSVKGPVVNAAIPEQPDNEIQKALEAGDFVFYAKPDCNNTPANTTFKKADDNQLPAGTGLLLPVTTSGQSSGDAFSEKLQGQATGNGFTELEQQSTECSDEIQWPSTPMYLS